MSSALNQFLPPPAYGTVAIMGAPTTAERAALRAAVLSDIAEGYPIVCTVESGFRPAGYPSDPMIIHYVTVVGYRGGGDEV